jgi:hypothetical protein
MDHDDETTQPQMSDMDRMTMELLLNKTHYAKYLAKTDSVKYVEFQKFVDSLREFRNPLVDITQRLICAPKSTMFSQDMIDSFQTYAQTVIRFLEIQKDNPADDPADELFPVSMNGYTLDSFLRVDRKKGEQHGTTGRRRHPFSPPPPF